MTEQPPARGEEEQSEDESSRPGSASHVDSTDDQSESRDDEPMPAPSELQGELQSRDGHVTTSPGDEQESDDDASEEDRNAEEDSDEDDEDEEEEEEEEPQLKYVCLTQYLRGLYRNGDATSAFMVAADKMIIGTHNGNINAIQVPNFQSLRSYHAHAASVTAISISPFPPPLPTDKPEQPAKLAPPVSPSRPDSRQSNNSPATSPRKPREALQLPRTPANDIYIATSSMDGNVCVQSLVDMRDVQLRNFARPVQAVALSPEYKTDRTYLSGGLAGQLILTVGGGSGRSTSTTTGTAAAAASGWLGSMGIGTNTGKDTILHSGEGTISIIKWSLSGRYVVWLNEHGIKIIRSSLHLDGTNSEDAWKRIGHVNRPQTEDWETMASVWKGRVDWIDEQAFEADESESSLQRAISSPATEKLKEQAAQGMKKMERLLVGWGNIIWIIHVHHGSAGSAKSPGNKSLGHAEIVKVLRMDCIISGVSLYTQNLLLVLAYCLPEEEDEDLASARGHRKKLSTASVGSEPSGGIPRRQNNQPPELRLIDLDSQSEVDRYSLGVSRYERLSSNDYHLGVLPARNAASAVASSRGALEALAGLGTDMWNVAINPKSLFSSGASIKSRDSGEEGSYISKPLSSTGTVRPVPGGAATQSVHPNLVKPGAKIFIHSPYDCGLLTRRDLGDHLDWLLKNQQYRRAWELLDENPEILPSSGERPSEIPSTPTKSTSKEQTSRDDFYDDESIAESTFRNAYSAAEKEKRRIGELWIQELIENGDWASAGQVCGKVLNTPDRWEKWMWRFAGAKKFEEITNFIPSEPMQPPIPTTIYEVVLGHYLQNDKLRFRDLLERWSTDVFDINTITTALEDQLKSRDVSEDTVEGGEKGRDWRIVMESLATLHEAGGRFREALKCYVKLQDADSTFRLIRDNHLAEAVADEIPSFIGLRVPPEKLDYMSEQELDAATSEAITLLVDEAQHGLVRPEVVVDQLMASKLDLYLFFYMRGLWKGDGIREHTGENIDRLVMDSQSMADEFADLVVHLFATYKRDLLMEYLKTSTSYQFEKAVQECEIFNYYDELVYLYSKTGQMKRALYLIIDRLEDVHKAIEFAKEQDDPDLWEDLLKYSMDKPSFIRGLLEHVGTAINPITLVRRIPEGLEIQGLREGLTHMMKEHEIQYSISSGVARVLRSEVATAQNELRAGQRKGIKFEVDTTSSDDAEDEGHDHHHKSPKPGHCAQCRKVFTEDETETLLGFACGHVFHVSHLLEMLYKGKSVDVDLGGPTEEGGRHLVGMKVMRARLLRDKVRSGCPMCHVVDA